MKQLKQYASADSSSSGGEGPTTTMTKQGETLPLQAYDEFSESRHESSSSAQSQPTTNCHSSYPSDTHDGEDREQQLFAPIPFVRSSTSCSSSSRNRLSQLSVNTFASGVATEDMDRDEDIIDSPSYHYASLSTPRNSPTNGNSSGQKRSRSSMPWLALAAGAGVAVLGAAAFWSDSIGNAGPLLTDEQFQTKQVPPLSELVVGDEIRGNVDWMIDFAIIGNPKCGTTFLMVRSLLTKFGAFGCRSAVMSVKILHFIISYNSIGLSPSYLLYPSLALARSQS